MQVPRSRLTPAGRWRVLPGHLLRTLRAAGGGDDLEEILSSSDTVAIPTGGLAIRSFASARMESAFVRLLDRLQTAHLAKSPVSSAPVAARRASSTLEPKPIAWQPHTTHLWRVPGYMDSGSQQALPDLLHFVGGLDEPGTFPVAFAHRFLKNHDYWSSKVGETISPSSRPGHSILWIRSHGTQASLVEHMAALAETIAGRSASSPADAVSFSITQFQPTTMYLEAQPREHRSHAEKALQDLRMLHLQKLLRTRSSRRISELRKELANLDQKIAEAQEQDTSPSGTEWVPEGPGQGLKCEAHARNCSIVALWSVLASLAEYSETTAPIDYIVVS